MDGQIIKKDPSCDFDGLVPGSEGYLQAYFRFSPEWSGTTKVVAFWSVTGKEYPPRALDDGTTCIIPSEALKARTFKVQIIGKKKDGTRIPTNKLVVSQDGGIV